MSAGRQLSSMACKWLKLHNLIVHYRCFAAATASPSPVASSASGEDILDDFTARLMHKKTLKWNKQISPTRQHDPIPTDDDFSGLVQKENTLNDTIHKIKFSPKNENDERKILAALSKSQHNIVENLLENSEISEDTLTHLFKTYSNDGNVERVIFLQNYCKEQNSDLFLQNGEFMHFLAKAFCLRGNSEDGLSVITDAYEKHVKLRNTYRTVIRDLIKDSASNRSVASQVVFKKYVVLWSERWSEHYPLVCFWHSCWSSKWFCDQTVADELIASHKPIRDIVHDRASVLCVTALRCNDDEDTVTRLLQILLKYRMMTPYRDVLQILFDFKLKEQDKRGCSEILKNCMVLGITLPPRLRGKYIHMIINGEPSVRPFKITKFKLNF